MQSLIPFEPAFWAKDRHSQTILGDLLPSPKIKELGDRLLIQLEDGDQLLCRLHKGSSETIFLLCHGLTGSSDAGYIHRLANYFHEDGHTVCRMNHRNCGESLGLAKNPYHSGRSDDIARIIFELRLLFPQKKIICIGFSMSGNASLLLGAGVIPTHDIYTRKDFQKRNASMKWATPDAIVTINPPGDLAKSSDQFLKNINRLYQWNFIRGFQKLISSLKGLELLEGEYETHPLMTLRSFDEVYTSQRAGFKNAMDYYHKCSSIRYLHQIDVPTYILASEDDPIIDFQDLAGASKSELVKVVPTKYGGHMGFIAKTKTPRGGFRWMDYAVLEIAQSLI